MISIVVISKDEAALDRTLAEVHAHASALDEPVELLVVDASDGRLDDIRLRHEPHVIWVQFKQPPGVRVTIPHQRNAGVRAARGEIIVFTDAGCLPEPDWLPRLIAPLFQEEHITAGLTLATPGSSGFYDRSARKAHSGPYLRECPTINMAFRREAFDAVGGFDETFRYGSDVDFTWRLTDSGYRIRSVPDAVIRHDWGAARRQLRRSYVYGRARMRLYLKHRNRWKQIVRNDPTLVVYPVFLIGLPLTIIFPFYPALLLIPAWRNREDGAMRVVVDHLAHGVGALRELVSS